MNPTNSQQDLAATCRLFPCLPAAKEIREDATEGSIFHRFLQRITEIRAAPLPEDVAPLTLEEAKDVALHEAPVEYREALAAMNLEQLQLDPSKIAVEVAFAYDAKTGKARELGRGIERRYDNLNSTEWAGTIDRAAIAGARRGYVGDYKKGGWTVKRAKDNRQLKKCALDVARAWDLDAVEAEIIRIDEDGETWHDQVVFEAFDLDLFEEELRELALRIEGDRQAFELGELPEATMGRHCRFCPGAAYCPARGALARAVVGGENQEILRLAGREILLNTETAPRIYELVEQAQDVIDKVKESLRDFARQVPYTLSDGRVVGPVPWPKREVTDGRRAGETIGRLLGASARTAAEDVTITLDGIGRAVRAWLKDHPDKNVRGVLGKTEEQIFEQLLKEGLARKVEQVQIRAVKPKQPKK